MALTHYDEPRTLESDPQSESIELLQERRAADASAADREVDPSEPPGFEAIDEEMTGVVVPMQDDEFRCGKCFLVLHRTLRASAGGELCRECASS
jgi:hypothetical protein